MIDASEMPEIWLDFAGLSPNDLPSVPEPAFPPKNQRFTAFHLTSPAAAKVVILGLDPYHTPGAAHGLSFSVLNGNPMPPSLRNIYKELYSDLSVPIAKATDLTKWAESGVLLLNCLLSVAPGVSKSHEKIGWQKVTDAVISKLGQDASPRVFILWGNDAKEKRGLIDESLHLVIASSHPSPLFGSCNKGFFGSKPFSTANRWLEKNRQKPIDWRVDSNELFV